MYPSHEAGIIKESTYGYHLIPIPAAAWTAAWLSTT